MKLKIDDISTEEVLHYLGYGNHQAEASVLQMIETQKQKVLALCEPRYQYQCYPFAQGALVGVDLPMPGRDIQRLLKESHHVILLAATLGLRIEKEMRKLQVKDMGEALIFDSCASAAIERLCDMIQENLENEYKEQHRFLTDRYSCGYGDLPLTIQKDFLRVLDTQKRIGLYVSESFTLHPTKSVTAILGVADKVQPAILRGCAYCELKDSCLYRKGGTTCGN